MNFNELLFFKWCKKCLLLKTKKFGPKNQTNMQWWRYVKLDLEISRYLWWSTIFLQLAVFLYFLVNAWRLKACNLLDNKHICILVSMQIIWKPIYIFYPTVKYSYGEGESNWSNLQRFLVCPSLSWSCYSLSYNSKFLFNINYRNLFY